MSRFSSPSTLRIDGPQCGPSRMGALLMPWASADLAREGAAFGAWDGVALLRSVPARCRAKKLTAADGLRP